MEILTFRLKGKTAFFKRPDVNSVCYFTYGNIHKVALLGLFGAIMGYSGYGFTKDKGSRSLPEFYEKLKHLRFGIVPVAKRGTFPKKIQTFNNSVGYASQEQGGNLIVKEQWLEMPAWDIYVVLDSEESQKLAKLLMESKCTYIPYLGKNDHPADIEMVRIVDAKKVEQVTSIHSLFLKEKANLSIEDDEEGTFIYEERLPMELLENGMYRLECCVQTDFELEGYAEAVYEVEGKIVAII